MKIPPPTYDGMKSDIRAVAKHFGLNLATADGGKTGLKTMWELLTMVSRCRAYDDSHPGFSAGQWPRILPFDGRDYTWYYQDGCNDSHVETALKKIKAELIEEGLGEALHPPESNRYVSEQDAHLVLMHLLASAPVSKGSIVSWLREQSLDQQGKPKEETEAVVDAILAGASSIGGVELEEDNGITYVNFAVLSPEIRNLKIFEEGSEETTCFVAELSVDGKPVARLSNDGKGGENRTQPFHPAAVPRSALAWVKAWVHTHPTPSMSEFLRELGSQFDGPHRSFEIWVGEQIDLHEVNKTVDLQLAEFSKPGELVFRVDGTYQSADLTQLSKLPIYKNTSMEDLRKGVIQSKQVKHPGVTIFVLLDAQGKREFVADFLRQQGVIPPGPLPVPAAPSNPVSAPAVPLPFGGKGRRGQAPGV